MSQICLNPFSPGPGLAVLLAAILGTGAVAFRYHRFSPTRVRSRRGSRTVQLPEFSFFPTTGLIAAQPAQVNNTAEIASFSAAAVNVGHNPAPDGNATLDWQVKDADAVTLAEDRHRFSGNLHQGRMLRSW